MSSPVEHDGEGHYDFAGLPYGHYQLDVSSTGFASQTLQINVKSTAPVLENVTVSVAATSSRLNIVGTTPLAGTDLSVD